MNKKLIILAALLLTFDSLMAATCAPEVKVNENQKDLTQVAKWSYSDFKSCMNDLGKNSRNVVTNLEGIDSNAIALKCGTGPTQRLSTFFSEKDLALGKPMPADHPEVYVYLTSNGFQFAEFPTFYYFVKYNDGTGAIDVGTAPGNVQSIVLQDGKEHIMAGNGVIFSNDQELDQYSKSVYVNGSAAKSKAKYVDKYKSMLITNKMPLVSLKPTISSLTLDQVTTCFMNNANHSMNNLAMNFYKMTFEYDLNKDATDIGHASPSQPEVVASIKAKYKKTKEEFVADYVQKMKNETPNCKTTFSDQDYKDHAEKALSSFLENYSKIKHYIDSF